MINIYIYICVCVCVYMYVCIIIGDYLQSRLFERATAHNSIGRTTQLSNNGPNGEKKSHMLLFRKKVVCASFCLC